jgi:hypothetical protein
MNHSAENSTLFATCKIAESSYKIVRKLPSNAYEHSRIAMIVINCILSLSAIILNGVSVITIRKSSQLRRQVCYFMVLIQSAVDLGVGILGIPLFIYCLLSPFLDSVDCTFIIMAVRSTFIPCGLSIITLSAMTIERYIGVLYSYSYQTRVTRKRILAFVCGGGILVSSLVVVSAHYRGIISVFSAIAIPLFFLLTGFVYTRIYLAIRKLVRSEKRRPGCESDVNENCRKRKFFRECRHAKSCFLVVICFGIFLLPITLSPLLFKIDGIEYKEYFFWCYTLVVLNSSVNSVIFFWTKTLLRKEAFRILKYLVS